MADNVSYTAGSGTTIAADEVVDGTLGTVKVQYVKLMDGTLDGSTKAAVGANGLAVSAKVTDGVTSQGMRADGYARVQADPTTLLIDTFEILNTNDTWFTGGIAPTVIAGTLTINAGTVASASSYLTSRPTFSNASSSYLQSADIVTLSASAQTGGKAVWGLGVVAPFPTALIPISNGAVYEILDTDGALYAAVYSNNVRTQQLALTRPTDGGPHRYAIYYKASKVYFELDGVLVGNIAFPNPTVAALGKVIGVFNGTSTLGATVTLLGSTLGVADTGKNSLQLSDGSFPWKKAVVSSGALKVDGSAFIQPVAQDYSTIRAQELMMLTAQLNADRLLLNNEQGASGHYGFELR